MLGDKVLQNRLRLYSTQESLLPKVYSTPSDVNDLFNEKYPVRRKIHLRIKFKQMIKMFICRGSM